MVDRYLNTNGVSVVYIPYTSYSTYGLVPVRAVMTISQ